MTYKKGKEIPAETNTDELIQGILVKINESFPHFLPNDPSFPLLREPDYNIFDRLNESFSQKSVEKERDLVFSVFAIDELLEEATSLIGRLLELRRAKHELEVRAVEFWLDYSLFKEREGIRRQQIEDGELELPSRITGIEKQIHEKAVERVEKSQASLDSAVKMRTEGSTHHEGSTKLSGELAFLSSYYKERVIKTKAMSLAAHHFSLGLENAIASASNNGIIGATHDGQCRMATAKLEFENYNKAHKLRHFEAEVENQELRARIATETGTGLNYFSRILEVQRLFDRDYVDLIIRIRAIEEGVLQIFGLSRPLPPKLMELYLTEVVVWARDLISDLAKILDKEITYKSSISLRKLVECTDETEASWSKVIEDGVVKCVLPESLFPKMCLIRVQKIQMAVRTSKECGFWQISASLPKVGDVRYESGKKRSIDQSALPALHFGDVGERLPGRNESSVEARAILNSSPLGRHWVFLVSDASSYGCGRSQLEDIELDLTVSALTGRK